MGVRGAALGLLPVLVRVKDAVVVPQVSETSTRARGQHTADTRGPPTLGAVAGRASERGVLTVRWPRQCLDSPDAGPIGPAVMFEAVSRSFGSAGVTLSTSVLHM